MADTPLSLVPLGQAGTGSAFVLDQRTAEGPLRAYAALDRQRQAADAHAARLRQQEADRLAKQQADLFHLQGSVSDNWVSRDQQDVQRYLSAAQSARSPQELAALRAERERITANRVGGVGVKDGINTYFAVLDKDPRVSQTAKEQMYKRIVYDAQGNVRDVAEQARQLREIDPTAPDWYDRNKVYKTLYDTFDDEVTRTLHGPQRPGAIVKTVDIKNRFGLEVGPDGLPLRDKLTGHYIPRDPEMRGVMAMVDRDPIARQTLLADTQQARAAWLTGGQIGPEPTTASVLQTRMLELMRPDVKQGVEKIAANPVGRSAPDGKVSVLTANEPLYSVAPGAPIPVDGPRPTAGYGMADPWVPTTTPPRVIATPSLGVSVQRNTPDGKPVTLQNYSLATPGVAVLENGQWRKPTLGQGSSLTITPTVSKVALVVRGKDGRILGQLDGNDDSPQTHQRAMERLLKENPGAYVEQGYNAKFVDRFKLAQGAADGDRSPIIGYAMPAAYGGKMEIVDAATKAAYEAKNPGKTLQAVTDKSRTAAEVDAFLPATPSGHNALLRYTTGAADRVLLENGTPEMQALMKYALDNGHEVRTARGIKKGASTASTTTTSTRGASGIPVNTLPGMPVGAFLAPPPPTAPLASPSSGPKMTGGKRKITLK